MKRNYIKEELNKIVPNVLNKINQQINVFSKKENFEKTNENKQKRKFTPKLIFAFAMCCCVIVCFGIVFPFVFNFSSNTNEYNITLSINPSIMLYVKDNKVIKQQPLNEDGVKLLFKEKIVGLSETEATKKVLVLAHKYGYLTNNKEMKLSVTNNKNKTNKKLYNNIQKSLTHTLAELNLNDVNINLLNIKELEEMLENYDDAIFSDYEKDIINQFSKNILKLLDDKILNINNLLTLLNPYNQESDDLVHNNNLTNEIKKYVKLYSLDYEEIDLNKLTYSNCAEIIEILIEDKDELVEILEEIADGADEEDYEDVLEDLFELAKELVNKETEEDDD